MLARYARKIDPFLVTTCRNLSFIVTFLPLLFLAPTGSISSVLAHGDTLLLAALFGLIGFIFSLFAQRTFPVGIVFSFSQMTAIWLLVWSLIVFHDAVPWIVLIAVFVILLGIASLGLQKSHMPHLDGQKRIGLIYALIFPFFASLGYFFMAVLARETHPFVAGYFWEVMVGILSGLYFLIRKIFFASSLSKKHRSKITWQEVILIALYASATLIGTGLISVLMVIGSPGIVQSIVGPLSVIFSTLLAAFFYGERLKLGQWISIATVLAGVVLLKLIVGT